MFLIGLSSIPLIKIALQFPHNKFKFPLPFMTGNTFATKTVLVLGLGLGIILSFRSNPIYLVTIYYIQFIILEASLLLYY